MRMSGQRKDAVKKLGCIALISIGVIGTYLSFRSPLEDTRLYIEKALSTKAEFLPEEGVMRVNFPRQDIKVSLHGWPLDPFMGLTSWVAFQKGSKQGIEIMAMGDVVLLEDEVNFVMSAALEHDIKITALHNHFFFDKPKVYFMHLEAEGTLAYVTTGIGELLSAMKHIPPKPQVPLPVKNDIHSEPIEKIIGVKGSTKEGMLKIVIGRITRAGCGCRVGKSMGVNTWAAFGGTDDNAIVVGDFAVLEDELQEVLKSLRAAHIAIVAIHNHMIQEKPRMIFVHYWGQGKAIDLAQGIKNALHKTET